MQILCKFMQIILQIRHYESGGRVHIVSVTEIKCVFFIIEKKYSLKPSF